MKKLALITILILSAVGHGSVLNLEEGIPITVTDAYATPFMNREIQFYTRYQHKENGTDQFKYVPVFEYGIMRNAQIEIEAEFLSGNADRDGSGDIFAGGLYNFNTESLNWPAFSVAGGVTFPSGKDSDGYDSIAKFILTKTIIDLTRMHINIIWEHNDESEENERDNAYTGVLGISTRVNNQTVLVGDYVWSEKFKEGVTENLLEIGIRYQLFPVTVIAAGFGTGIGDDSPDIVATLGFQHSF